MFCRKLEDGGPLQREYRLGLAEAKEKLLKKAFEKATEGKGDTIMLIFLLKCLAGLNDKGETEDLVADKAAAIRDAMDQMNSGLTRFTDADGKFDIKKAGK